MGQTSSRTRTAIPHWEIDNAVERIQLSLQQLSFSHKRLAKIGGISPKIFSSILAGQRDHLHRDTLQKFIDLSNELTPEILLKASQGGKGYKPYNVFDPTQVPAHKEAVDTIRKNMDRLDYTTNRMAILSGISKDTFFELMEGRKKHFRGEIIERFILFSKESPQAIKERYEGGVMGNQPYMADAVINDLLNRVNQRMGELQANNYRMARMLGIDPYAFSQILAGKRRPTKKTFDLISAAMNKDSEEMKQLIHPGTKGRPKQK